MEGAHNLSETSRVSLWDVAGKKEIAHVDVGPSAKCKDGYCWAAYITNRGDLQSARYRASLLCGFSTAQDGFSAVSVRLSVGFVWLSLG